MAALLMGTLVDALPCTQCAFLPEMYMRHYFMTYVNIGSPGIEATTYIPSAVGLMRGCVQVGHSDCVAYDDRCEHNQRPCGHSEAHYIGSYLGCAILPKQPRAFAPLTLYIERGHQATAHP